MQVSNITLPGYREFEYRLVLELPQELRNKIRQIKKEFHLKYKTISPGGDPQIPLVHFVQHEMMEERIINRLRTLAMGFPPFKSELKGFGSFPTHTLVINVASKLPVQSLVKLIRTEAQRLMKMNDDHKPHFIMEPHLTIAAKLKPWQYEKGWLEYSNKHFTGRFIAESMLMLKRPVGESKYQAACSFEFRNMPVTTKQGDLFS